MRAARLVNIPVDHVTGTFAAFPLVSEAALAAVVTSLHLNLAKHLPTQQLWRQAELSTLGHFPGFSVDEAVAIRDRIWFDDPHRAVVPLHVYLRRIADWFLEDTGTLARPRLPRGRVGGQWLDETPTASVEALARRAWKWLTLQMPGDLLLAALGTVQFGPTAAEVVAPVIERQLADNGFAEAHLHYGAGMDFASLWVAVQHSLTDPKWNAGCLASPGAELREGRDLAPWLVRGLLMRYVLGAFLAWGDRRHGVKHFLENEVIPRLRSSSLPNAWPMLLWAISDLRQGRLSTNYSFAHWQRLYAHVTAAGRGNFPSQPADVQGADTLARLLWRTGPRRATPEMQYVAMGLEYLEQCRDPLFEQLFWQTVRVRGLFFRHIVQRPLTPGLTWFVRFYGRLSKPRQAMSTGLQLHTAAKTCGLDRGLRAVEYRTCPDANVTWMLKLTNEADRMRRLLAPRHCEVGLVLHFAKERGGDFGAGYPHGAGRQHHADPRSTKNPARMRFSWFFSQRWKEALSVAWLLKFQPHLQRVVRGVDVCTDELGVPNWVLAPVLEHVRSTAQDVAQRCGGLRPLRTTVHAGEDFVHLLTGLRFVDEAIEQFRLRDGDRIGHGLALGIDPREWARRAGRLAIAREDRLFDLVWEWSWHERHGSDSAHRGRRLDRQIALLSEQVFRRPIAPFDLRNLADDLYDARLLRRLGFPSGPLFVRPDLDTRYGRLSAFLSDGDLYRSGRETLFVDPFEEGELLAGMQAELRRKVGARGIAVEINPTSNLLIGDLEDLTAHPLWRLRPPRPGAGDAPPVSVCIGSDDPVVFNTDLRQEYQCLSDAMKLAGLSDEESLQWLDRTRRAGLDTRFTQGS